MPLLTFPFEQLNSDEISGKVRKFGFSFFPVWSTVETDYLTQCIVPMGNDVSTHLRLSINCSKPGRGSGSRGTWLVTFRFTDVPLSKVQALPQMLIYTQK